MRLASTSCAGASALSLSFVLLCAWTSAAQAQQDTSVNPVLAPPGDRPVPPPPPSEEPQPIRPHLAEVDARLSSRAVGDVECRGREEPTGFEGVETEVGVATRPLEIPLMLFHEVPG